MRGKDSGSLYKLSQKILERAVAMPLSLKVDIDNGKILFDVLKDVFGYTCSRGVRILLFQ